MLSARDRSPLNVDTSLPAEVPIRTRTWREIEDTVESYPSLPQLREENDDAVGPIAKQL